MGKSVYIAEKPSVALEFARVLKINKERSDGYIESENVIVTWCVGHLVSMSYPEAYDEKYRKWNLGDLPFIPDGEWKYEVIPSVRRQFETVKKILNRDDVDCIYVCTDSGREGEYIYRLVAAEAGVTEKKQKRVWIDSQTEEEILRGIREARDLSAYDNLALSAYLRAKEDYLIGINFSRLLTLKYGRGIQNYLGGKWQSVNVGRVMTCVLGMICSREIEIRNFKKTPFYKINAKIDLDAPINVGWKVSKDSKYYNSPLLYKENGFKKKIDAEELVSCILGTHSMKMRVESLTFKTEKKQPPLLYNLAELQNDCSKMFKISPDQTLSSVQSLYEAKLVTYPRTDARVISTAVAKEIKKNISGLVGFKPLGRFAARILEEKSYLNIEKSKYTDDKKITDHYAIIPTGQGMGNLSRQSEINRRVYLIIAKRFLSIFYPPAVYKKASFEGSMESVYKTREQFNTGFKILTDKGYLEIAGMPRTSKQEDDEKVNYDEDFFYRLSKLKKGDLVGVGSLEVKEGETTPPKRYTSGSLILAMENAGQFIEDEDLRATIKGTGIGTSATRAEIIKKLTSIKYLKLNKKTQVITPTQMGEMIYGVVHGSIKSLLNPKLTASWELGLSMVAKGELSGDAYMDKLKEFIIKRVENVRRLDNTKEMLGYYDYVAGFYKK